MQFDARAVQLLTRYRYRTLGDLARAGLNDDGWGYLHRRVQQFLDDPEEQSDDAMQDDPIKTILMECEFNVEIRFSILPARLTMSHL